MFFTQLTGHNFRLFRHFALAPAPRLNLITGANAAGKTTLLEAIYALGRGRSFRGAAQDLAGPADAGWTVQGGVRSQDGATSSLGLGWTPEGLRIRIDQSDAVLTDLARSSPIEVLEPDSHRLLEDGPVYRRRYLDWGVFHVEHRFHPAWRRYQRAQKQRNQALRDGLERAAVEAWNEELATAGEEVHECRARHVAALQAPLAEEIAQLLGGLEWSLELRRGWAADQTLAQTLAAHYDNDARQGTTVSGPHRAELKLKLAGHATKHHASRGQQKLLIAALLLAQARLIREATGRSPILLIDDFPAELGPPFQEALMAALRRFGGQCFVTSIEHTPALQTLKENTAENAMFHVEHGAVSDALRV
ncbi:MAG TPA: DNA replication/repair protein RecF [Verrucomicrobiae bacterium]|nr:DNA replication/repair protein RecF [Verrucomicrobiae bacterium]